MGTIFLGIFLCLLVIALVVLLFAKDFSDFEKLEEITFEGRVLSKTESFCFDTLLGYNGFNVIYIEKKDGTRVAFNTSPRIEAILEFGTEGEFTSKGDKLIRVKINDMVIDA